MPPGPPTTRPDTYLGTVAETLREGNVRSTLVTNHEGRLIGTVYLEDIERKIAESREKLTWARLSISALLESRGGRR